MLFRGNFFHVSPQLFTLIFLNNVVPLFVPLSDIVNFYPPMEKMTLALISASHKKTYIFRLPIHCPHKILIKLLNTLIFGIYKVNVQRLFIVESLVHCDFYIACLFLSRLYAQHGV